MGKNDIVAGIRLEGEKKFKDGVTSVNKSLSAMKSEMALVKAEYAGQENTLEALTKKQEVLNKILEEQKRKASVTKAGLENATEAYNNIGKSVEKLKSNLEKEIDKLHELEKVYGSSSKEVLEQKKVITALNSQIEIGETNWKKAGDRIEDWKTKLNTAEAQVIRANKELNKNAAYMKEAEAAADKCATSIDKFGKEIVKVEVETNTFTDGLKANLLSSGIEKGLEIIAETADKVKDAMYDLSGASAKLQANTGASTIAMNKYNSVMKAVKANNFGESYEEVAEAMGVVIQTFGELNEVDLQNVTENAMTLQDSFGYDYQESLRAVNMLMQQFGISSTEAFNLIVQGTQKGLNKNGDLLDTINEYSVHYAQMGTSADQFFNSLSNGTAAGTFSVDKLGDAYKEFGIRVKDTAATTDEAYEILGLNADRMRKMFSEGGESASEATDIVLDALMNMDDKVKQNQAGVDLFGTMWEDLGISGVSALTNLEGSISSAKTAMDSLKNVSYSDLESAVSGLGAAIEENITTPFAESVMPGVTGMFEAATEIINGIGDAIAPQKTEIQNFVDEIETSNDEVAALLESARKQTNSASSEIRNLEAYKNVLLTINEVEKKDEFQKYQVKSAVDALAQSIPELKAAYDEESGSINLTNLEIEKLIENQERLIMQNALMDIHETSIRAVAEATLNKAKADAAVNSIMEEGGEELQNYIELMNSAHWRSVAGNKELAEMYTNLQSAKAAQSDANEKLEEANSLYEEETNALEEVKKQFGLNSEEIEKNSSATDANAAKQEQLSIRQRNVSSSAVDEAESLETATEAIEENRKAAEEAATAHANAAKSIIETYRGYVEEIKADLQNKISLFDKFDTEDGGEDQTVEAMTENLNSQIEAYQEYEKNLAEVRDHVGKEIAPEFMQYLETMGMEGANTLKHIIATFEDNEPEKVKAMSDKWIEAMNMSEGIAEVNAANKLAYEAAIGDLGSSDADFSALRESVDSAVSSAAEGWKNLPDETRNHLNEAITTAQECGVQIPEGLTEGILSGETSPESAIEQLNSTIQGSFDGLAEVAKELGVSIPPELAAGIEAGGQQAIDAYKTLIGDISAQAGSEFVSNMENTSSDAGTAAENVAHTAADSMTNTESEFTDAGNKTAQAYVEALNAAKAEAAKAGGELGSVSYNALAAWQNAFYTVGTNMVSGVAQGIYANQSSAVTAAASMARSALKAAKDELGIKSPSRRFRKEVGQNISESTAFGIKDKASLAGKEASKMSEKVYTNAAAWLEKYKKTQKVSAKNEKYYWEQVLEHTKKGSSAYEKALSKLTGISLYTTKNKKKVKKDAETFYGEILQAAQKYYEKQNAADTMSLRQQKKYWTEVRNTLKKGTQAWLEAQRKIDAIKSKIGTVSNADAVLGAYQTYYDMSEKAVVEYWDIVRQQYEAGTDERLEADQKYFEAKEELNNRLLENDEEYANAKLEIEERINKKIDELNKDYEDKVKQRAESIMNAFGLFDKFESESVDGKTLLFNIKTQTAGYEDWMNQMDILEGKGILSEELLDELKRQGPEMSAAIHALNTLTEEELAEYNEAYLKKMELSQKQAEEDTEKLKQSVETQTETLRKQMEEEKEAAEREYNERKAEINASLSTAMATLAQNVKLIAEDQTTALVAAIKGESVREGGASSVGNNVSTETLSAVSVTSGGLPSNTAKDRIVEIINSYPASDKLSNKELKEHSELFQYIHKNYKRKPGHSMYKKLADELGVSVDKQPTESQRNEILKKLKEKGYRSGGRNLLEELIWMDEDLDKIGPEMLVRKADNAILTRIRPGDDVINAETVSNMAKWAQYSPEIAQEALFKMQEQMMKQQATLKSYADTLSAAGIMKLNDLLNQGASSSSIVQSSGDIGRLEDLMANVLDMMAEFLPNLSYLKERQRVVLDKKEVTDRISNELAMRGRRRR